LKLKQCTVTAVDEISVVVATCHTSTAATRYSSAAWRIAIAVWDDAAAAAAAAAVATPGGKPTVPTVKKHAGVTRPFCRRCVSQ
jgi:hypothetical protein